MHKKGKTLKAEPMRHPYSPHSTPLCGGRTLKTRVNTKVPKGQRIKGSSPPQAHAFNPERNELKNRLEGGYSCPDRLQRNHHPVHGTKRLYRSPKPTRKDSCCPQSRSSLSRPGGHQPNLKNRLSLCRSKKVSLMLTISSVCLGRCLASLSRSPPIRSSPIPSRGS